MMDLSAPFTSASPAALAALILAALAVTAVCWVTRNRRTRLEVRPLLRRRLGIAAGVVRWAVLAGFGIVVLLFLGFDAHEMWSSLVAILSLVAIGFVAMWSILSHMLASILIVIFRPFEIGDSVELFGDDGATGEVTELNPVYTTLRGADGETLQIPNNLFFQRVIKRHAPLPSQAKAFSATAAARALAGEEKQSVTTCDRVAWSFGERAKNHEQRNQDRPQ